jgi:hypothetical protein
MTAINMFLRLKFEDLLSDIFGICDLVLGISPILKAFYAIHFLYNELDLWKPATRSLASSPCAER